MSVARQSYDLVAADLERKRDAAADALVALDMLYRDLPRLPDRGTLPDRRRHKRRRYPKEPTP